MVGRLLGSRTRPPSTQRRREDSFKGGTVAGPTSRLRYSPLWHASRVALGVVIGASILAACSAEASPTARAHSEHSGQRLVIDKAALTSTVSPGEAQSFFIEVTNRGDEEATNVVVTDDFGAELFPATEARWATEAGGVQDCAIREEVHVRCEIPAIAPGRSARITIKAAVVTRLGEAQSRELFGEKTNTAKAGAAIGSATFTVAEGPKLTDEELNAELTAINRCARDFAALTGPAAEAGDTLLRFAEKATEQQGVDASTAAFNAARDTFFLFATDRLMSMARINKNVSLGDAAQIAGLAANCDAFARRAASVSEPAQSAFRYEGTWRGTVTQGDSQTYPVKVDYEGGIIGETVATVEYPTLECSGKWVLISQTDQQLEVEEQISEGGRCVDVTITLKPSAVGTLQYAFDSPEPGQATLRRD